MLTEQAMLEQEAQIPELARQATSMACQETLSAGRAVVVLRDQAIVRLSPDGQIQRIADASPPAAILPGRYIYRLRRRAA